MAYPYRPLGTDPFEIRLLKILPAQQPEDPVELSIEHASLDADLEYLALSYTWDKPAEDSPAEWDDPSYTLDAKADGQAIQLRPNLESALRTLRDTYDAEQRWWVDAVCIDQSSTPERSSQVTRMAEIYERSQACVIWLGPEDRATPVAMLAARAIAEAFLQRDDSLCQAPIDDEHVPAYEEAIKREFDELQIRVCAEPLGLMLGRTWFRRAWAIPEVAAAPQAIVQSGTHRVAWGALCVAQAAVAHATQCLRQIRDEQDMFWTFNSLYWGFAHLQDLISAVNTYEELKSEGRRPALTTLLTRFNHKGLSDPRDRVYAMVGLSASRGRFDIDYSLPVEKVYIHAIKSEIEVNGDLRILAHKIYPPNMVGLPSWASDFDTSHLQDPMRYHILPQAGTLFAMGEGERVFSAGGTAAPTIRFEDDDKVMVVQGFVFDTIAEEISPVEETEDEGDDEDDSGATKFVLSDGTVLDGTWLPSSLHGPDLQGIAGLAAHVLWSELKRRVRPTEEQRAQASHGEDPIYAPTGESLLRAYVETFCADMVGPERRLSKAGATREDFVRVAEETPVLRAMIRIMEGHEFRVGTSGAFAFVPDSCCSGDVMAVVQGSELPLLLRRKGEGWEYVGQCYVHGYMDGETLRDAEKRGNVEELRLVVPCLHSLALCIPSTLADRGDRGRGRGARGGDRGGRGGDRGGRGSRGGGDFRGRGDGGDYRGRGRGDGGDYRGRGRGRGDDRGGFRGGRGDRGGDRGGRGGGGYAGPPKVLPEAFAYPDQAVPVPSREVTALEDRVQARASPETPEELGLGGLTLREGVRQPDRPGFGSKGSTVTLWANYFELKVDRGITFYRYDLDVKRAAGDRADPSGKKLEQIVKLLFAENPTFESRKDDIATDYRKSIVSAVRIPNDEISDPFKVTYRKEDEDEPRENAPVYEIHAVPVATHSIGDLLDYVTSSSIRLALPNHDEFIRSMGFLLADYAKRSNNMVTPGKSKSFSISPNAERFDLGQGLTGLRGFFSSVRLGTGRVLLNINVSHAAFYNDGPLEGLMQAARAHGRSLESFLRLLRVRTTHLPEKRNAAGEIIPKVKTIAALAHKRDGKGPNPVKVARDFAGPNDVQFWIDGSEPKAPKTQGKKKGKNKPPAAGPSTSGRYISVSDYFKEFYNTTIRNTNIPVINVGTRDNPSYLPAQVCVVMPGQSYMKKLSPSHTAEMIRFAVRKPHQNAESITSSGPSYLGFAPGQDVKLQRFGVGLHNSLITVQGRVLGNPSVKYKKNGKEFTIRVAFGGWNMSGIQFMNPRQMPNWSYLRITYYREENPFDGYQELPQVMQRFQAELNNVGIRAGPPASGQQVYVERGSYYYPELEEMLKKAANHFAFLMIILPDTDAGVYNRIKQMGDLQLGMHTVCCVESKLRKQFGNREQQFFANLALKVNLKLGGTNQVVDTANLPLVKNDNTMFVGVDVTHPSPGSASTAPSVAAMVANTDSSLSQWPADLRIQQSRQEEVNDLEEMLVSRLDAWMRLGRHRKLPDNILVFRDGVSESQYDMVRRNELPLLQAACKRQYPATDQAKGLPRISILVVGKRHHTRFYPTNLNESDGKTGNAKPGTVVDRGVTEARDWDFFLQAHTALQGTARPAHYYMVYDEIFTPSGADENKKADPALAGRHLADELQSLALAASHMFGRATKVISVAAPARYADMACDRSRVYLSRLFDPELSTETESTATPGGRGIGSGMPQITLHPRIKDTMFYV